MISRGDVTRNYIQSAPVPVHFAGFKSDTLSLQGAGWQFSAEQEMRAEYGEIHIRIAAKHERLGQYMWFNPIRLMRGEVFNEIMDTGLAKIVSKESNLTVTKLKHGEHIVFINRARDKVKMFSGNNILSYMKMGKGEIVNLETLRHIPAAYTDGDLNLAYSKALTKVVKGRL